MKNIYLDNAAATPLNQMVIKEITECLTKIDGNPSSFHSKGLEAKEAIDDARKKVANTINCKPNEIIFTSGGTESINLALKGIAFANKSKGNHIITSKIEHHAVLNTCKFLEKNGFNVTYLDVDKYGQVNPQDIEKVITDKTIVISIMYANNEIGTIEPIERIGNIAHSKNVYFHSDGCQAGGLLPINVQNLNVDLFSLNGSKMYGPKGTGILYVKNGIKLEPLIHGGGQENGLRSGTENVGGIVGFSKALELAQNKWLEENKRLSKLSHKLIEGLLKIPKSRLNGHPTERLINNVNISFLDVEGESIVLRLNEIGIYASTSSACTSKSLETSHVLKAIGLPYEASHGSIRFTLGDATTEKDIDFVIKSMHYIVEFLRKISPLNLSMEHFK
ncbi:IscS subfamily cysteine desulfurase [Candidatus Pacearchaeota archaeon]|nr:IscS subfamily cysteine desulfurase [Candidatus Pacearchaeota archaeon]